MDAKGRWRSRTVAFRVSDEEAALLNQKVAVSGLTKQDYIIRRLMDWEVTVQGNPRVYKALKDQMQMIYQELTTIRDMLASNPNTEETPAATGGIIGHEELLTTIRIVAETLGAMKEGEENVVISTEG